MHYLSPRGAVQLFMLQNWEPKAGPSSRTLGCGHSELPKMLPHLLCDHAPVQANVAQEVLIELGQGAALSAALHKHPNHGGSIVKVRQHHPRQWTRNVDCSGRCGWEFVAFLTLLSLMNLRCIL